LKLKIKKEKPTAYFVFMVCFFSLECSFSFFNQHRCFLLRVMAKLSFALNSHTEHPAALQTQPKLEVSYSRADTQVCPYSG
jgi:hypothetical protein